jgi:hypothetical protein
VILGSGDEEKRKKNILQGTACLAFIKYCLQCTRGNRLHNTALYFVAKMAKGKNIRKHCPTMNITLPCQ